MVTTCTIVATVLHAPLSATAATMEMRASVAPVGTSSKSLPTSTKMRPIRTVALTRLCMVIAVLHAALTVSLVLSP